MGSEYVVPKADRVRYPDRDPKFATPSTETSHLAAQDFLGPQTMSTPPNIAVFNLVAAQVFVRLYETFPTPTNIDPMAVGIDVLLQEKYPEESTEYKHLVEGADAAVQFLIDEGFVRVASGPQYLDARGFQNLVLSSKGFSLLQKTPEAIDSTVDRRSYIERLKSATASGAKVVASEAVGPLIARLVGAG